MQKSVEKKNGTNLIACESGIVFDILVILMLLFSLLYTFISSSSTSAFISMLSYLCAPLSAVGAIALLSVRKRQNAFIELKDIKADKITVLATLLITIGMIFGLSELNTIFVNFLESLGLKSSPITLPEKSTSNVIMVTVFVCLFPSIFEEMIFRGIIVKGLRGTGEIFTIIMSGLMFSLFHMSAQQTVYQFIVGALYAFIVLRGGSWVLTLVSHFINNLFIVINFYYLSFYPTGAIKIVLTIVGLILLFIGVYLLYKNDKKIEVFEKKRSLFLGVPIGLIICVIMWFLGFLAV